MRGLYSQGLIYGGKFACQNRLGELIAGRKFTASALFYFVFEGNFPSTSPPGGGLIVGGVISRRVFFVLRFCVAYIWRGLYMEGLIFGILR